MLGGIDADADSLKRFDDAEQTFCDLYSVEPNNIAAEIQLGSLLTLQKKYQEADTLLEAAAKLAPDNKVLQIQAGSADLGGQT